MNTSQIPSTAAAPATPFTATQEDIEANRDIAALGYVWILSIVVYIARRDSVFVRFHARQGMVLFGLSIVVWFVPLVGRYLELIVLALAVLGFLTAAQGQMKEVMIIGPLSRFDRSGMRRSWREFTEVAARSWRDWTRGLHRRAPKATPAPPATSIMPGSSQPVALSTVSPLPSQPQPPTPPVAPNIP